MKYTNTGLRLNKPDGTDYYNIGDANTNMNTIANWAQDVNNSLNTKATKTEILSATIAASSWSGTSAPYRATVSVSGIVADDDHTYFVTDACTTVTQKTAFVNAGISIDYASPHPKGVANGQLYLIAFFNKPTVSLPIKVEKRRSA